MTVIKETLCTARVFYSHKLVKNIKSLLSVLSFNELSDIELLWGTFFDSFDYLTANIMLPLGGFAIAIFTGWFMSANSTSDEIDTSVSGVYRMWRISARFIAPIAVLLIFLNAIGIV